MPKLTDFAAFIFDLDGLVLDTEPTYFAAWQKTVETMGFQLEPALFRTLSGFHYQGVKTQLQAWLGQEFDLQAFDQLGKEIWRHHVHEQGIQVKPGVIALLDYARQQGIPICLATNSLKPYAQECLAVAGLTHRFPTMVTGSDVERAKPAPDIFLKAAEKMQVDIRHCVIFEDSPTGVAAAVATDAYTVYVPSIFPVDGQAVEMSNCVLDDLTQVFETLPPRALKGI
ncbi:HAD-superfamily hydrolase, subfamily IA, variant 3 [Methyloglobulus morosus KoM1]|uniref:HAD-superfamily hydrolase, subfamily IA, variant 3 n=1 Tax=Methyloglobulus morosus KoM1 TaxID=1116472 RepID=V5DZ88_9GAMM|nr:HAD family phosphatase [Methyloglobulus morosus]ESS72611.1 HAD-superfamily hydrolase, subfamily IA, variant 3 [Methyloglobulus morosus KoM1]